MTMTAWLPGDVVRLARRSRELPGRQLAWLGADLCPLRPRSFALALDAASIADPTEALQLRMLRANPPDPAGHASTLYDTRLMLPSSS